MIPNIALMLAAYMVARLLRSCIAFKGGNEEANAPVMHFLGIVDGLAICAIAYLAYSTYDLATHVASTANSVWTP